MAVIRACFLLQISTHRKSFFSEIKRCSIQGKSNRKHNASRFVVKAASIGGSSAEFPESLAGDFKTTPKKRKTIAGVDQEELLDPDSLSDPDSLFCEFNGVKIHHKISHHSEISSENEIQENKKIGLPMVLLHGFGASVFSWTKVMKPLAGLTGSKVLAFDRPAFGLTSRERKFVDNSPRNPYSMAFSILTTLSFIDMLGSNKAILIGHSAGCLVAVSTYLEAPERIAALILIAPAIFAPIFTKNPKSDPNKNEAIKPKNPLVRVWRVFLKLNLAVIAWRVILKFWRVFLKFCMKIAGLVVSLWGKVRDMVGWVYKKVLGSLLRSALGVMLIRIIIDKFGIQAVRNAWYDPSQVSDHVLKGYTKPLRVKNWEMGLLEYSIAMITDSSSKPPLSNRLSEISCPVLVVTGDTDRLVPAWNAKRVSEAIPRSEFKIIKNCGHLPHEEKPEEFLSIVQNFLQNALGAQTSNLKADSDW
ncbi:hypothetical protein LUZ60_015457 [Juncus effusus]|nr:hypothetical protein LUZ60_015457 [Juncus effusus]